MSVEADLDAFSCQPPMSDPWKRSKSQVSVDHDSARMSNQFDFQLGEF